MKKLILICMLCLAACGADKPKYAAIAQGATVLILGDSLSYGTGANTGEDYPTLLTKTTGWNMINEGVPGDTTAGGLARLPALLEEYQPKLLIVELGGNDFLHQISPVVTKQNLVDILGLAKAQGIQAVLVAIPAFSPLKATFGNLSDHALYEEIAKQTNTPLITNIFSDVLSDRVLKADQIHPNAKGYVVVSEMFGEKLRELGYLN